MVGCIKFRNILILLLLFFMSNWLVPLNAGTLPVHDTLEEGGYITAISLTAQCGNGIPISVASGTYGTEDLPGICKKIR